LTVRDSLFRVVQVLTSDDFRASNVHWTVRIPGNRAFLDLQNCAGASFPDVRYEEFIAMPDKSGNTLYSSVDPNAPRWFDLYSADSIEQKQAGDSVGLLIGSYEGDTWAGSGVMIAPDLFLTNWHNGKPDRPDFSDADCWSDQIIQRTVLDLSWDTDGVSREYSAVECMAMNKDLDFAIIRVQPITTLGDARPAILKDAPVTNGQPLFVIHHPLGLRKQITVASCNVTNMSYPSWFGNIAGTDFTHQCDTEGGSSGGAVYNMNGEVVGLHHRGYSPTSSTNCQLDKQNKAVQITKILSYLRQHKPALLSRLQIRN
jgi:hypothetical protein